jgi:hypothetical protein
MQRVPIMQMSFAACAALQYVLPSSTCAAHMQRVPIMQMSFAAHLQRALHSSTSAARLQRALHSSTSAARLQRALHCSTDCQTSTLVYIGGSKQRIFSSNKNGLQ